MKRLWILGLAMGILLAVGVAPVTFAGTPPDGRQGKTDCIGWCLSHWSAPSFAPGAVDEFARSHNQGTGCGMMKGNTISEASPPTPQN